VIVKSLLAAKYKTQIRRTARVLEQEVCPDTICVANDESDHLRETRKMYMLYDCDNKSRARESLTVLLHKLVDS
jgi:hypothetical protein